MASLQYSCLENPIDGGSLAGYSLWGRSSRTRLEWLYSHSLQWQIFLALNAMRSLLQLFNFCYFSTKQLQITYQQTVITVFRIKYMIWTTLPLNGNAKLFFFLPVNDQEFQNIIGSAPNQMGALPSRALWLRRLHTYEARLDCAQRNVIH